MAGDLLQALLVDDYTRRRRRDVLGPIDLSTDLDPDSLVRRRSAGPQKRSLVHELANSEVGPVFEAFSDPMTAVNDVSIANSRVDLEGSERRNPQSMPGISSKWYRQLAARMQPRPANRNPCAWAGC
ncbi:MAG: hypothetical protein DWQ36_14570 [Acidobacteria bacterium]|nr:MAG: hypothetical protein DWQ30_03305 [Acidobacteriota bacterium]REK06115.1 MAG: hypothetical protein DWQ36_14570 [Acidobacteriota bacterium]